MASPQICLSFLFKTTTALLLLPITPCKAPLPLCDSLSFPSLSSTFLLFSSPLFVSPLFSSPVLSSPRPSVYPIWQSHLSWELSQGTRLLIQFLLNLMALASAFAIRATCGKTKARRGEKKKKWWRRWVGGGGLGGQSSLNNLSEESVPGWLKQTDKPHFKTSRLFCSLWALVSWTAEICADGQAAFYRRQIPDMFHLCSNKNGIPGPV